MNLSGDLPSELEKDCSAEKCWGSFFRGAMSYVTKVIFPMSILLVDRKIFGDYN